MDKSNNSRSWGVVAYIGLTDCQGAAMLSTTGNKPVGFRSLRSIGVNTPRLSVVFLRPKKIITPKIRDFHVMVARSGQPRGWPAPIPGTANLLRAAAQLFAAVGGGLSLQVLELPL